MGERNWITTPFHNAKTHFKFHFFFQGRFSFQDIQNISLNFQSRYVNIKARNISSSPLTKIAKIYIFKKRFFLKHLHIYKKKFFFSREIRPTRNFLFHISAGIIFKATFFNVI